MAKKTQDVWKELMAEIPKEHKRTMNKLIKLAVLQGRSEVLDLVQELGSIPVAKVTEYGVWHEDNIDGG